MKKTASAMFVLLLLALPALAAGWSTIGTEALTANKAVSYDTSTYDLVKVTITGVSATGTVTGYDEGQVVVFTYATPSTAKTFGPAFTGQKLTITLSGHTTGSVKWTVRAR